MAKDDPLREEELKPGLRAAFGGDADASVLASLEGRGRSVPRVLLRDLEGDDMPLLRPRGGRTGRYQIVGEIARGGVGVVLQSRDVDLGRDVAMKVLRDEHARNRDLVHRFVEEAQIGGQLQHPGIVPVYEMGLDEKRTPFFTMKLVKGRTLAALLHERRETRRGLLALFLRVCDAMAYAHSRGVVHRDLKPANVIAGAYGEVQIVDWGFAKVLGLERPANVDTTIVATVRTEDDAAGSVAGSVMGTPAYMPPEQALGQVDALDERSDVFALGAILCEILTEKAPYVGATSGEILAMAAQSRLDDAHARLDACGADAGLVALARECLAPEQSRRPPDAAALATRVRAHLDGVEARVRAAEVAAAEESARAVEQRRGRRLTLALAATVLLVVTLAGGGWFVIARGLRQRIETTALRVRPIVDEAMIHGDDGRWEQARAAARRAFDVARAGHADEELRAETAALLRTIDDAKADADAAADRERDDNRMLDTLARIRAERSEGWDGGAADRAYADAFGAYGVDVETPDAADAIRGRARRMHVALATALDDWAWVRRGVLDSPRAAWAGLLELASAADPDADRAAVRAAVLAGDPARLRALAERGASLPSATLVLLAVTLNEAGEGEAARTLLRAGRDRHVGDVWIHYQLGLLLRDIDRRGALRALTAAFALRPENTAMRRALADALFFVYAYDEAIVHYERVLEADPEAWYVYNNLGNALRDSGRVDEAIEAFKEALKRRPDVGGVVLNLGMALWDKNDAAGAIAAYRKAIELSPGLYMGYYNLATTYGNLGDHAKAIEAWAATAKRFPRRAEPLRLLARALDRAGEPGRAVAVLRRALERHPADDESLHHLAWLLASGPEAVRKPAEAVTLAKELVRRAPDADRWNTLAVAAYRAGHFDASVRASEAAMELAKGGRPIDWAVLAMALARLGRTDDARAWLEKARAAGTDHGATRRLVAEAEELLK